MEREEKFTELTLEELENQTSELLPAREEMGGVAVAVAVASGGCFCGSNVAVAVAVAG